MSESAERRALSPLGYQCLNCGECTGVVLPGDPPTRLSLVACPACQGHDLRPYYLDKPAISQLRLKRT